VNSSKKHSILIVDDEPDILQSLLGLLRREFELFTATSGEEALAILKKHPIQVVMTDQRMPGMTGVELMRQVRVDYPDSIRIVFTGYADIKAVVEAINTGGLYRYITKPWDPDNLIELLHQAASEHDECYDLRRLAADLRQHILQAQQLVGSVDVEKLSAANGMPDVRQFTETGQQLLARLDQIAQ